jgi:hypothetical protein
MRQEDGMHYPDRMPVIGDYIVYRNGAHYGRAIVVVLSVFIGVRDLGTNIFGRITRAQVVRFLSEEEIMIEKALEVLK